MAVRILTAAEIRRALTLRDLTDAAQGPHAMQQLIDEIETALATRWGVEIRRNSAHPVVSIRENYERLLVGPVAAARDSRYTRYVNEHTVLRTMASAMIPPLLDELAARSGAEVLLSCPGLVYRRDAIDRHHVGEPHQLDLWRIRTHEPALSGVDLEEMIGLVVDAALPGRHWRVVAAEHPYTVDGLQIDVETTPEAWLEIGECGMANPRLLLACGIAVPPASGLAMGLGLDRLLMLRKGIDDIRLLRSDDPRVASQMLDLVPYRPVSAMPEIRRDLSIAVAKAVTEEEIGDRVREALGADADCVEAIEVAAETSYDDLPEPARVRLGITADQKNVLVRIVLRHLVRTLTDEDANALRDRIYAAIHEGTVHTWACRPPPSVVI